MKIAKFIINVAKLIDFFNIYINIIDRIDIYKKFEFESRYIIIRFVNNKFLLYK